MKSFELKPTFENLMDTFLNDSIGRSADVCAFTKLLLNIEGSLSLGVDGKWGTGKTFFVRQTQMVLDSLNPNIPPYSMNGMEKIRDIFKRITKLELQSIPPIVTAYYDAWQHDDEEDPILSLLYEIMKENYNNTDIKNKKDWSAIVASIAEALSNRNIGDLVKNFKGKDFFEDQKDNEELDVIIENFLSSFLPERGNRLIVFIDELDRCKPTYAVKLLERIKHYYASEYITFVFSVNFGELENTVRNYYGERFDACRYMDRFFDIRMEIPPIDMNKYVSNLGLYGHRNMRETVCAEVIRQMNLGMRETARFLQMSKIAAYKYTDGSVYEKQRFWSHDDGISNLIGFCIIVPIAMGLKMTNSYEYDEFIAGKSAKWLDNILTSEALSKWVTNSLLSDNESYTKIEGKALVSESQKIQEVYEAIFVKTYESGKEYETRIGKAVFEKGFKDSILKAIGFVSPYTDYSFEDDK